MEKHVRDIRKMLVDAGFEVGSAAISKNQDKVRFVVYGNARDLPGGVKYRAKLAVDGDEIVMVINAGNIPKIVNETKSGRKFIQRHTKTQGGKAIINEYLPVDIVGVKTDGAFRMKRGTIVDHDPEKKHDPNRRTKIAGVVD